MASEHEIAVALYERAKVQELVEHEGFKIIVAKMQLVAAEEKRKVMDINPSINAVAHSEAWTRYHIITRLFPAIVEPIVNYDPDSIDKQVAPQDKWSISNWFRRITSERNK